MTTSNSPTTYIANGVDVTVSALPGSEHLPTLVVMLETTGSVYLHQQGAAVDPPSRLIGEHTEIARMDENPTLGATFEFGWAAAPDAGGAVGFVALGPVHTALGTIGYPGSILFGGHPKPV